jgi:hypothetical protein
MPNSSDDCTSLVDGTLQGDASALLTGMEDILAMTPRPLAVPAILCGDAAEGAAHR